MRRLLLSLVLFAAAVPGLAQKFIYGSYFDYYFDNREFDRSHEKYMESETLHSVLVAPELGLSFKQGEDTEHRILVGTDIMRDTGSGAKPGDSFREVTVYYNVRSRFGNDRSFEAAAGVFPRRLLGGRYSRAIWSDAHTFYDMNMEGVLLKYGAPAFNTEIGCDWMGMYSADRRERFQIFSSGEWKATDWLSAGWGLSFYHYATSAVAHNVIDNHLLNPWLKADAAGHVPFFTELSLQAGWLAGYQRSREIDDQPALPMGAEFIFRAARKSLCLQNSLYAGQDLYHYYSYPAPEGGTYGADLYPGENTYRGFYNRAELIWTPRITKKMALQIVAAFHFDGSGYLGCQQAVRLKIGL